MTSKDFCYWLQGCLEISDVKSLNEQQVEIIQKHLSMVFVHEIDPSYSKESQNKLNQIHNNSLFNNPDEPLARC